MLFYHYNPSPWVLPSSPQHNGDATRRTTILAGPLQAFTVTIISRSTTTQNINQLIKYVLKCGLKWEAWLPIFTQQDPINSVMKMTTIFVIAMLSDIYCPDHKE